MRRIVAVACLVALSGCSSVSGLFSSDNDSDDEPVAVTAPVPVAVAAPDDSFCRNVAVQDAAGKGYDDATQKRIAQQSYLQCRTMYGAVTSR